MKVKESWHDITVGQFIELNQLSDNKELDDFDKAEYAIAIIYGIARQQVQSMQLKEFNALAKSCKNLMDSKIEGNPKKIIKGTNHKYFIEYDPHKLTQRQFVEIQFFSSNMMDNIHLILASIVNKIGKFGKKLQNKSEDHSDIANDLLGVPISDIYNSCVFFCKLYLNSLVHIRGYLIHKMMKEGATKEQAQALINSSINVTAGSITPKPWLITII